jgi:choline-sulfatase
MKNKSIIIFSSALGIVIAAAVLYLLQRPSLKQDRSKKYNVILIVADALRFDTLGCYGGGAKTPNIDRLSKNGVTFTRAYSTAPCTMPSSVGMLTGNHSMTYGAIPAKDLGGRTVWSYFFYVPNQEQLLGESLRELGYQLKMSVENPNASGSNNLQGFDILPRKQSLSEEQTSLVERITGIQNLNWDRNGQISSRYSDCYTMLHTLLQLNPEDSFFMVKWFQDPHPPLNPPEKFKTGFSVNSADLPRDETYYTTKAPFNLRELSPLELSYIKELYRAEVESIDERVGFILKALEYRGLLEETYIIFTSDHGEMYGEHNRMSHGGGFWEELMHIPLIISGPNLKAGTQVDSYLSLLDLMPTLKDLLGIKYSDNMQGQSFLPALLGRPVQDRILYFDQMDMQLEPGKVRPDKAIIMHGHKFMMNFRNNRSVFSLFDLENDPQENENLLKQKKEMADTMYQEILERKAVNTRRRERAMRLTVQEIDFKELSEETIEKLKTLGYIK